MASLSDTSHYTCAQCGSLFQAQRKRALCGAECRAIRTKAVEERRRRKIGKRPLIEFRAEEWAKVHRECPECKRWFRITRHDNHSAGPQVFCGNHCRQAENRRQRDVRSLIQRERQIYRQWSMDAKRRERDQGRFVRDCIDCGCVVEGRWKVLCDPCSDARRRRNKRAAKAAGRARLRAARIEVFDPVEVLERDGWRCHLCGVKTPKSLRGTYDDRAPELDHIVPLAAGGEHSRRNTACACRKCNGIKSDKPLGQMRLVA